MKNLVVLTSFFLGSSLLASTITTTERTKAAKRFNWNTSASGPVGTVSIVIDKSDYELSVYDDKG